MDDDDAFDSTDSAPAAEPSNTAPDLEGTVMRFFGAESPLAKAPEHGGRAYEERPQQRQMALAISGAFGTGQHLCVEAPTGVGKSFAYLVPAIYWAKACGQPVVISTHTIALQEQLLSKDLPVLQQLVDVPFSMALAKGRQNYVCLHRLEQATLHQTDYLPLDDTTGELQRLAAWANSTNDGSLADLSWRPSQQIWTAVCSEAGVCPREATGGNQPCFFQKARRKLYKADIIIANHALVCADLAVRRESQGQQGLLPDYAALILDEAHTFEEVAATHLGVQVTTYGIVLWLNRLYNPRTQRGLLARGQRHHQRLLAERSHVSAERWFMGLRQWLNEQPTEGPVTYFGPQSLPDGLEDLRGEFAQELRLLIQSLQDLLTDEGDSEGDDPAANAGDAGQTASGKARDWRLELKAMVTRLEDTATRIEIFFSMAREECVYWFEFSGRRHQHISCNCVPIAVDAILKQELFSRQFTVIMTSATLALGNDMQYFQARLGCPDAQPLILDSPFDFQEQMDLYVPDSEMPLPDDPRFVESACQVIRHFLQQTNGKAFVLFTSYSMMNTVADLLEPFCSENRYTQLVQGRDLQRSQMLDIFRRDVDSVIFGTDSFWTGVDVPGEALSNVIIVKLPFPVPSHPLVAAREKRLKAKGRSAFREYMLPEAILKFRQGVGRLIRAKDDHGIIVVLDARIMRSNYGTSFLNAIPQCPRHLFSG